MGFIKRIAENSCKIDSSFWEGLEQSGLYEVKTIF